MGQRHVIRALAILAAALSIAAIAAREFTRMWTPDIIVPAATLTRSGFLSEYFPDLKGTSGDTRYYLFDSGKPGASVLLLGGTHPNESAGFMAAVTLVENISVQEGRVFVIPQACASGFTATEPLEGYPEFFTIPTKGGGRTFRFGSRGASPVDHWPDPLVYLHSPSGQQLSGNETRNLNRSYPGSPTGTLMERVGHGIMLMLQHEQIDVAFDLHEAAPEIPIINAIVVHEKAREIAGAAVLNLEFEGLQYALEISPKNFRGLSHREWGDAGPVIPFLMETSNPIQGRLRGITDERLILEGVDIRYKAAAQLGTVRITYDLDGEPLARRVGRHVQGFRSILDAYNEAHPEKRIDVSNLPTYAEMVANGVGAYLNNQPTSIGH